MNATTRRSEASAQQQDDHAGSPAPSDCEHAYAELSAAWLAMDGSPAAVKRMNMALGMLGVKLPHPTPSAQSSKAALSDEEIKAAAKQAGFLFHTIPEYAPIQHTLPEEFSERCFYRFARAILARAGITRKPLTEDAICEMRRAARNDPRCVDQHWFVLLVRAVEEFHGITPQAGKESGDA